MHAWHATIVMKPDHQKPIASNKITDKRTCLCILHPDDDEDQHNISTALLSLIEIIVIPLL
jgi:hypothetical protein